MPIEETDVTLFKALDFMLCTALFVSGFRSLCDFQLDWCSMIAIFKALKLAPLLRGDRILILHLVFSFSISSAFIGCIGEFHGVLDIKTLSLCSNISGQILSSLVMSPPKV
ncbi:hypothetical protein Bca4012_100008 [Brassica carinata]|uniref:BnaCnng13630D protein n=3 Tax=Brassica TaxID=3705 RepID=A0A078I980_BRANA|nr:hypothetical protein HID58_071602 [Brassica napus]CAF2059827.1 unnamed protein product [Brassica napus]CDY45698.1 BnaCnng13630D [Brassica napus]VDD62446.1 unnamed protein product [Brassica oleracea]